jgi:type IV pilus assembly protein PilQ
MMSPAGLPLKVVRLITLTAILIFAATSAAPAEEQPLRVAARRISVDFHDADIKTVLLAFSEFSGVSIIASQNVSGSVTARITDQPWDKALYSLLRNNGLDVREENGILNVDTIENIRATEQLEDLVSQIFRLNYQKSSEIAPTITALLSERGKLQPDPGSNSILVIDIPDRIEKISEVLAELDSETRQVEISVQLTFINKRTLRELGIDWRTGNLTNPLTDTRFDVGISGGARVADPHASLSVGTIRKGVNFSAVLNALESMNKARTIAKPVITTLNNLEARVLVGERTPLRVVDYGAVGPEAAGPRAMTEMVETGVKLQVLPQITENNKILVQILAENSTAETGAEGVYFKTQEANTRLLLDDGSTGVIAGLTVTMDSKVKSGVPGLSKVPLLGRLFSYDKDVAEEEELVIIISAHIINPSGMEAEESESGTPQAPGGAP